MAGVHALIPAAGAARRMRGADKLLEEVGGVPQIRRAVDAARKGGAAKVWLTLPPGAEARRAAVAGTWAKVIEVPEWEEGIAASLRAGVRAASVHHPTGLMILLADLPGIGAEDVGTLIAAHREAPEATWRGTDAEGAPGHPVIVPARLFPRVLELTGDEGAKTILNARGADVRPVVLPGDRATLDLDTPEAWAAWRARS